MSVLNQSGEEQVECPLCMEPLEVDDLNFFPCTCGYQICRFCWHRIRTDENGLCPACRKAYSENPADFIPLSKEQVSQLKAEKRQRDQQRKAKLSESRKHLASVRVVQRNLVFVVGLPMRLADPEVLKKHEYFGKFGKIHKVVINQSTAYAGTQGPSASAYVTYMKSDDALRAIQMVNNSTLDGKTIKTSLGTTKYCSHFMKNQPCPKPDCMYLHDFGDQEASFTKEQMHAGKHQEYEKKLHDSLLAKLAAAQQAAAAAAAPQPPPPVHQHPQQQPSTTESTSAKKLKENTSNGTNNNTNGNSNNSNNKKEEKENQIQSQKEKENGGGSWPHLDKDKDKGGDSKNNKATNGNSENAKDKPETKTAKRNKNKNNVSENNSKNKTRNDDKDKDKDNQRDSKERDSKEKDKNVKDKTIKENVVSASIVSETEVTNNNTIGVNVNNVIQSDGDKQKTKQATVRNNTQQNGGCVNSVSEVHKMVLDVHEDLHDNSSFFTSNSFSCAKLSELSESEDDGLLNRHQAESPRPQEMLFDGEAWDFDFGYTNHSHHLEELATQTTQAQNQSHRLRQNDAAHAQIKDPLDSFANGFGGLDTFSKLDAFMDAPYISASASSALANTESLLETLAKNSVNYQVHPGVSQAQVQNHGQPLQQHRQPNQHFMNGSNNGLHKDVLSSMLEQQGLQHQQQQPYPKLIDMYRNMLPLQQQQQQNQQQMAHQTHQSQLMNGFHNNMNSFQQQQQQQQHHYNPMSMMDKQRMVLLQQQRAMEDSFVNLTLGKQLHPQVQQQQQQQQNHGHAGYAHGQSQMNGHFDFNSMGNSFGLGNLGSIGSNSNLGHTGLSSGGSGPKRHTVVDDKDLDFRFQEAQKALEALVESDNHVHNSGRTTLGSNQLNGLVHSQSSGHLPPPPPGFVQPQPNTHMNSFGSKILPFLNMNSQQQQQINTSQNNWPSSFSQIQQQQQQNQHNKGMGNVCNDWKVLDTAIISSRRHIPSMGPLIGQYAPEPPTTQQNVGSLQQQQQQQQAAAAAAAQAQQQQQQQQQQQRTYENMYATFSNYSSPLPYANAGNGYQSHLSAPPNLAWLGGELSGQISTPPGFRTAGQTTKQQEC